MNFFKALSKYSSRRVAAVFLLSFSSGLPYALLGSTLQAWYTTAGVSLLAIGMLSLIRQPYIFKFLWAPLLDRFVPFHLGRRRSWILLMQLCLIVVLTIMAFQSPQEAPLFLAALAFIAAFFSATQDIAVDAYRADVLEHRERGFGAAVTTYGYRLALLVSGALALIFAAEIGWRATYLLMAGCMLIETFITFWSPNPSEELMPPSTLRAAVVEPFQEFLQRPYAVLILIFLVIYKLSDVLGLALNTTFLLRGVGFTLLELGSITKVLGLLGGLLGSIAGAVMLPSIGMYRSLFYFGFIQMSSNLLFALLAIIGKSYALMSFAVFADYFSGGLCTVAFVALLMALCNRKYTATQYALFSAITSIGQIIAGPWAALMVDQMGWAEFYVWVFVIGIPSLFILWWLRSRLSTLFNESCDLDSSK